MIHIINTMTQETASNCKRDQLFWMSLYEKK